MVPFATVAAAFSAGLDEPQPGETEARIRDCALAVLSDHGARRMSMEDVARRAGVSRVTVYRHFRDKDALILSVLVAETRRCLDQVIAKIAPLKGVEERFVEGFVATVDVAWRHPLFARMIDDGFDSDAWSSLPISAAQAIDVGGIVVADEIRRLQARGHFHGSEPEDVAETLIRLWQSIVFVPSARFRRGDLAAVERLARRFLYPLLGRRQGRAR